MTMRSRLTMLLALAMLALALAGCSKCGWIWDDWGAKPKSCHGDVPR